jgi:ethylmalonyl-CoA/methylmalonyl-CoA decarboxylase
MRAIVNMSRMIASAAQRSRLGRQQWTQVQHLSTLLDRHSQFLNRVKEQGTSDGGRIKLAYISDGKVADIQICNIAKKNAISGKMMFELAGIVDEVTSNTALIGCVIRGEGDFFCSGADLSLAKEFVNTPESGLEMSAFMTEALNKLRDSDVISLGMLNGPCLGGGSELSTVPDFRMFCGSPSATTPYICFVQAKLGVTPGWGGAGRLQSIVGRRSAIMLLGSSLKVDPDSAVSIGLVDNVVQLSSEQEIVDYATMFFEPYVSQRFPDAVRAMKHIVSATDKDATIGSKVEMKMFGERWGGRDNAAALRAGGAKNT